MKIQQLRSFLIARPDPVDVQAALDLLRAGKALSAVQSGTVAYPLNQDGSGPLGNNVEMAAPPVAGFDGVNYYVWLFSIGG